MKNTENSNIKLDHVPAAQSRYCVHSTPGAIYREASPHYAIYREASPHYAIYSEASPHYAIYR